MKWEDRRRLMVEKQLKARGVSEPTILNAFLAVERHLFVPEGLVQQHAYNDTALPIGEGQTISQPFIVAVMLELLDIRPEQKVLEIGTGSGYQTAVLSMLAKKVYTVERVEPLFRKTRNLLQNTLKLNNVYYNLGDGSKGWERGYPACKSFERIVVAAACPQIPAPLQEQLAEGGKMVLPAGDRDQQELLLIKKINGELQTTKVGACTFVPLIGAAGWQS